MDSVAAIAQHLLEFSPDALIVVDSGGTIIFANTTSHGVFGYPPDRLVGQSIDVLVPERYRLRHGAHTMAYMRDPTNREMAARSLDLFARRADGSEFPAGIRLAPFQDGDRTLVAAAVRDMTERRAISDALIAASEEADRANAAKTRFLATASHDLRQPLQTIRLLNASLLTLTRSAPEVHELLKRQEFAIDSASRLLNALLDITRLESGAVEPNLAPVSLGAILSELHREFETLAMEKSLVLRFSETSTILQTDRVLFTQLLQNILGNALKYTERGGVGITESLESDALVLTIEDTGVGIPADKLDRIFDEYYQIDPADPAETQRSGVGLGLAIVREVSRLLGYSVGVTSEVQAGTRVRLRIPRQHVLSQPPTLTDQVSLKALKPTPTRCRLVLIEDNDSVRAATELFLTLEGFDTRTAGSVAEAEPLLADLRPGDVLISDYHLDGPLTGLDVLKQLRILKRRDVPAILLSGDLQSMMRVVKTDLPNCRFLSKPVDTAALLTAIAELSAG